ncbi:MAG TPA: large-conductance mechanosensitive channel protein MscL [Myxococcota bacterium]|nr:large-conductance mechanosensitive channel protein MscL [Myxococcota bacterium]
MSVLTEFRDFINRGNVIDLAVGVIVGAAFGKIVTSIVGDVLMPSIGILMGGLNFSTLALQIGGTPEAPVLLKYGAFLQAVLDFVIVAFCVFLLVRAVNAVRTPKPAAAPPAPSAQEVLLTEIRDLLRARS